MEQTIPNPAHRVTIQTDRRLQLGTKESFEQGQLQNLEIIAFAQSLNTGERYLPVEVFYASADQPQGDTTEENYDAVMVDLEDEVIVGTLKSYDEIDPDWKAKREAQDG